MDERDRVRHIEGGHDEGHVAVTQLESKILSICETSRSAPEIMTSLGRKKRTGAFQKVISSLLGKGLIAYTIPEKPRSKMQKYMITERGKAVIEMMK